MNLAPGFATARHAFVRHAPTVDTVSIETARESLISTTLPHRYDADRSTAFHFRHRKIYLKTLSISDLFYAPRSYVTTSEVGNFFCFLVPIQGEQQIRQRRREFAIRPGELCIIDPTLPLWQVISSEHRMLNIRVDRATLDEFLHGTLNRPLAAPLAFATEPVPVRGAAASLLEFVNFLCNGDDDSGEADYSELVAQQVEQALLAMLLTGIPNNYQRNLERRPHVPSRLLERAENHISENLTDTVTVSSIADAAGISERAVYYEFARVHRMTPMQYVKQERLRVARERLQRHATGDASVSDVAFACGFNHLSKFARDYRARFGELPSETLRRHR